MINNRGSILLVSLVMMAVISITGLTGIKLATLEERMSGNFTDQHASFQAAESTLLMGEGLIESGNITPADFSSDCSEGLCFSGENPLDVSTCTTGMTVAWIDPAMWQNAKTVTFIHPRTYNVITTQYLIEFLCYLPKEPDGPIPDIADAADWSAFYRITGLGMGGFQSTQMMLQSTYKK